MKYYKLILLLAIQSTIAQDKDMINHFFSSAITDKAPYEWAEYLSEQIGERPTGFISNDMAVDYIKDRLMEMGLRTAYQHFDAPKWVRGIPEYAYAETSSGGRTNMGVFARGGAGATPLKGIKSSVIEIQYLEELNALTKEQVQGKMVFINNDISDYMVIQERYEHLAMQYQKIPALFAGYDAVSVIVRSLSTKVNDITPHVGLVGYYGSLSTRIPVATISNHSADILSSLLKIDPNTKFYLRQSGKMFPNVSVKNIIATLDGKKKPSKKIVIAASIDSWDIAPDTHSGVAGLVQAMGAIKYIITSGYKPKHTIALALFNGRIWNHMGAKYYHQNHQGQTIAMALQSPNGYTPIGFKIDTNNAMFKRINRLKPLLESYGLYVFERSEKLTTDIVQLKEKDIILAEMMTASDRHFDIIASKEENFKSLNRRELQMGVASLASFIYLMDKMID